MAAVPESFPEAVGLQEVFKDEEAGGWTDGGGRAYTLRTAGTTAWKSEWQRLQDASSAGTKQQVRAAERHPGQAEAE